MPQGVICRGYACVSAWTFSFYFVASAERSLDLFVTSAMGQHDGVTARVSFVGGRDYVNVCCARKSPAERKWFTRFVRPIGESVDRQCQGLTRFGLMLPIWDPIWTLDCCLAGIVDESRCDG